MVEMSKMCVRNCVQVECLQMFYSSYIIIISELAQKVDSYSQLEICHGRLLKRSGLHVVLHLL